MRQEGKSIFVMLASFHVEEAGGEFDHKMPLDVPAPEEIGARPSGLRGITVST